jgi:hypothetical protein
MLLETVAPAIKSIPAKPTAGGPVFVDISNLPNSVALIGDGTGWSAKGNTLSLKPTTSQVLPVWYQLTFEIDLGTGYSLLGAQLFTPGDASSIAYFPGSGGTVTVNLMSNVPGDAESVAYTLTLGFLASDGTQLWFDPTITFDPQG